MSNWDQKNPFGEQFPPGYSAPPPRSTGNSVRVILGMLGGGFVILLVFCGGLAFVMYRALDGGGSKRPRAIRPPQTVEERRQELIPALSADEISIAPGDLTEIRRLLDAVTAACVAGKDADVRRLADHDRFFEALKNDDALRRFSNFELRGVRRYVPEYFDAQTLWQRYRLVQVIQDSPETAIAYLFFWDAEGEASVYRMWLSRDGNRWKFWDYEDIDMGTRYSRIMAVLIDHENSDGTGVGKVYDDIAAAESARMRGDQRAAIGLVRRAEQQKVPPDLRDYMRLYTAFAWNRLDQRREALDALRGINKPHAYPGTLYLEAMLETRTRRLERVVDLVDRYEGLVGRGPHMLTLKAEALVGLHRDAEAAVEWRKLLRCDPENVDTLQSLATVLGENKDDLIACVERTADPAETAATLASRLIYQDSAGIAALQRMLERREPDSARTKYVAGLAQQADDEFAAAAALFQAAFTRETNPDKRKTYVASFLTAMSSAEQTVAGYQTAPDPLDAFVHFTAGYEEGESDLEPEVLRALVAAHRERCPDDPRLHYLAGQLLHDDGQFGEAEQEFAHGLEKLKAATAKAATDKTATAKAGQGDDDNEFDERQYFETVLRAAHRNALVQLGRAVEAYEAEPDRVAAFRAVAQLCSNQRRTKELGWLLSAHRAKFPNDLWLEYYQAELLRRGGDRAAARELLLRHLPQTANDPALRTSFHSALLELGLAAGDWWELFERIGPNEDAFRTLAWRLQSREAWSDLKRLIEKHGSVFLDRSLLLEWHVAALEGLEHHAAIVALLNPWPAAIDETGYAWRGISLRRKLVRAYLRLSRAAEATAAAKQAPQADDRLRLQILASAWERNVAETQRLLTELSSAHGSLQSLLEDEDVGDFLRGDEFLAARTANPPELSYLFDFEASLLLLKQPTTISREKLLATLAPLTTGELEFLSLPAERTTAGREIWIVRAPQGDLFLSVGAEPLTLTQPTRREAITDDAQRTAVAEHHAWLKLATRSLGPKKPRRDDRWHQLVLAALLDDNCLAFTDTYGWNLRINSAENRDKLTRTTGDDIKNEDDNESQPPQLISLQPFDDKPRDKQRQQSARTSQRRLKEFQAAFHRREATQEFQVQIDFGFDDFQEPMWLPITGITKDRTFWNTKFLAKFSATSPLVRKLRPGEPVALQRYQIQNWKYTDAQTTHFGTPPK